MGRYLRGNVDEFMQLGTLAAVTLLSALFDETVDEKTLVSSIVATWTLGNWTPIANAGPIMFGVAHSDYTDAEIEAYIEATSSWNRSDLLATREVAKRLIRRIGQFQAPTAVEQVAVINDGRPVKTKLNWRMQEGQTLRLWAYNTGGAAIATTDPLVRCNGHANLWSLG